MFAKTFKYIQSLKENRKLLAENLNAKGVECANTEKLDSLAKKITTIYDTGGLAYGEWMPLFNTDTFTIEGLNALPTNFGLSCEKVITDRITETGCILIALFNFEPENVESLKNAILYIINNPKKSKEFGENAKSLALEKFDRKTSYLEIIKTIEEVAKY